MSPPQPHLPRGLAKFFIQEWRDSAKISNSYIIKMERSYSELIEHISDPRELFDETANLISEVHNKIKNLDKVDSKRILAEFFEESLIHLIHSSNYIERAGLNLLKTSTRIRKIFVGETINAEVISKTEYKLAADSLINSKALQPDTITKKNIIHARIEVIQHTKPLDYILRPLIFNHEALIEDLPKLPTVSSSPASISPMPLGDNTVASTAP